MYKLFLAFRYFRSRWINVIPVICMTLGVMALIVILAVMDGFQDQLKATLRGTLSDIIIDVNYDSSFPAWEKVLEKTKHVKAVAPHLQSFTLVAQIPPEAPPGTERRAAQMAGAMVIGIDPEREAEVSSFRKYLMRRPYGGGKGPGESTTPDPNHPFRVINPKWDDRHGVILGRELANELGVGPPEKIPTSSGAPVYHYDRVYLTTLIRAQKKGKETLEPQQLDFCVTGIYESGNQEIDQHIAYLDRRVAKSFFNLSRDPEEIRVELDDYANHAEVKRDLEERAQRIYAETSDSALPWTSAWPPFTVQTWEDRRRTFLDAIENEKGMIAIIAGMAFIVTGFMIFSILSMIVTMKTRDIGILKALGGTTRGVLRIFLLNGAIVGVVGSTAGMALGLLFTHNINWIRDQVNHYFHWQVFPSSIYLFSKIPTHVVAKEVLAVTGVALVVALIGAILPALRAARLDPVECLRYE